MRSNKSLLYGLGSGMIIGALLLQLMNAAPSAKHSDSAASSPAEMDRQQLKEAASKYYQVFDLEEKLYTQAQMELQMQQKLQDQKDKQPAPAAPAPVSETVKETSIYVSKGLKATEVGDLLVQSGLIADRSAFETLMNQRQLNDKIVSGVHVFTVPTDLEQIVSRLTTPK